MKANELRCTNLVFYNGKPCKIALVGISGEIELYTEIVDWVECCCIEDIEPIPLTPEILEKAGSFIDWSANHYDHIKYFHQLQNLYFALTDKELEINM